VQYLHKFFGGVKMGATTTNPWLVSLINMTIVFLVLIVLWGIMHVLYMVDPTKKKKEEKKVEEVAAPAVEEVAAPAEEVAAPAAAAVEEAAPAAAAPAAAPKAAAKPVAAGATVVSSPMPGKISAINFKAGDAVKAGDVLIMLEAMKMQNEIMAPCDGTVSDVAVNVGQAVNTGEKLVVLG
jgi:biotin carboxyl carrier protein